MRNVVAVVFLRYTYSRGSLILCLVDIMSSCCSLASSVFRKLLLDRFGFELVEQKGTKPKGREDEINKIN